VSISVRVLYGSFTARIFKCEVTSAILAFLTMQRINVVVKCLYVHVIQSACVLEIKSITTSRRCDRGLGYARSRHHHRHHIRLFKVVKRNSSPVNT